ncbi:MAG: ABC transporter permease [Deltaproteobacteria bacterium]|nr:ABC transporter permease [Deltaproteobacteria bacterium]
MMESQEVVVDGESSVAANAGPSGFPAVIGQWAIHQVRGLTQLTSIAVAVIWQALQPLTWRRTVRAEFFEQFLQIGMRALPFILITGSLVGLGMVYQAIYWLGVFGQTEFTGPILVLVLVREVAPLFVALTVIGRSGSVILVDLGSMKIDGQVRMLDAQGIDPFLFLIVPRVVAVSVCMFCLTIVFIAVALGSGFMAGNALGSMDFTLYEFVFDILAEMGLAEFATIPLKTFSIGFVVALIACTTGLSVSGSRSDLLAALPRGVTKSVLAALLLSGGLTLLL